MLQKFRGSFVDKIHVHIQAGNGGMGNPKFGGIGGKGGDVYMVATKGKHAFLFIVMIFKIMIKRCIRTNEFSSF